MNRRAFAFRATTAFAGAVTLSVVGGSGIALALDDPHGDKDVAVSVEIAELEGPGVLAMTVAGQSAALTESGSTATNRQFTGTLPTVTVTDTRTADEIPAGAYWYVLGSITDFSGTAGQPDIASADSFGWTPKLVAGDPGSVAAGDEVDPGEGFTDSEMLAMAYDSGEIAPEGSWSANADLKLLTGAAVAPGKYSATLTLSLFE
ncbi:hypothetical protein ABIE21_002008 [Conyzicola nivalis]|uniref:WxL domain-containing protein n=1 Tax=Conyzicola nivalis TaxID=1477021 RepID=A0ABV2QNN5_9MICO